MHDSRKKKPRWWSRVLKRDPRLAGLRGLRKLGRRRRERRSRLVSLTEAAAIPALCWSCFSVLHPGELNLSIVSCLVEITEARSLVQRLFFSGENTGAAAAGRPRLCLSSRRCVSLRFTPSKHPKIDHRTPCRRRDR